MVARKLSKSNIKSRFRLGGVNLYRYFASAFNDSTLFFQFPPPKLYSFRLAKVPSENWFIWLFENFTAFPFDYMKNILWSCLLSALDIEGQKI